MNKTIAYDEIPSITSLHGNIISSVHLYENDHVYNYVNCKHYYDIICATGGSVSPFGVRVAYADALWIQRSTTLTAK